MQRSSVLISGLGVAGPTLAYWLKAAGFEPTIVERAPRLRRGGYVIDFWGLGYDIAERMELTSEIERAGYHVRELRIVDDRGRRMAGFGTRVFEELTGGRFVTIGRSDLSRLLFETIEGKIDVVFGDEIVDLDQRADGVDIEFEHGAGRRFDLVIGADGLHSSVRRLVFGAQDQFERQLGYVVAAFEVRGYRPRDDDVYVMYNEPGRMVGRFALHDDRTLFLFVFAADPQLDPTMPGLQAQKTVLRQMFGAGHWECPSILAELDRAQDLYFDQIRLDRWSKGRVALVGDAAFCVSLMAGQGSALAMTSACVLAGELAKADGRHEHAFDQYEALLREYIATKQKGAERFAGAFAPRTEWGLFVRNQSIRICALPGLARLTFGRDIVDTLQLPDYAFGKEIANVQETAEPRRR